MLPTDTESAWPPNFERLVAESLLARAAEAVPERGDVARLEQIAWWGAAVCWTTADSDTEDFVFEAAGAFNLAVATFDSVVDRGRSTALAEALSPVHLARVLSDPLRQQFGPTKPEHAPVTELFHIALSGFVERWGNDQTKVSQALELLSTMYHSEVGQSDDPMAAKILPSAFLGLMGTNKQTHINMHLALGRFLASWDDWMDLDEDLLGLDPNWFLGNPHGWSVMGYLAQAVRLTVSGKARYRVRSELRTQLEALMEKAMALDPAARSRTLGFVQALLQ